jgi:hypothetical protein
MKKDVKVATITSGIERSYWVQSNLTRTQRHSVALAIFLEVSCGFEAHQGLYLFTHAAKSSFAADDLLSNLVGFYRVVNPSVYEQVVASKVPVAVAEAIWDAYPLTSQRNELLQPLLFPTPHCPNTAGNSGPVHGPLPPELSTIEPAPKGKWHDDWSSWWPPFNDRFGVSF